MEIIPNVDHEVRIVMVVVNHVACRYAMLTNMEWKNVFMVQTKVWYDLLYPSAWIGVAEVIIEHTLLYVNLIFYLIPFYRLKSIMSEAVPEIQFRLHGGWWDADFVRGWQGGQEERCHLYILDLLLHLFPHHNVQQELNGYTGGVWHSMSSINTNILVMFGSAKIVKSLRRTNCIYTLFQLR